MCKDSSIRNLNKEGNYETKKSYLNIRLIMYATDRFSDCWLDFPEVVFP